MSARTNWPETLKFQVLATLAVAPKHHPRTEFRFHPNRRWRFDLVFDDAKLAVEVDGGGFVNGRIMPTIRSMNKAPKKPSLVTLRIDRESRDMLKVSAAQLGISIKTLVYRLASQRQ